MVPKPAILLALQEEIKHAKTCLRPSATGHIHTAISWMEYRVEQSSCHLDKKCNKQSCLLGIINKLIELSFSIVRM